VAGHRATARRPHPRSQHFLRSRALAADIVAGAGLSSSDLVLEIGAGTGRLTAELAAAARRVIAVELDPRLASLLRHRWTNVEVVNADATTLTLPVEPFRVVANLPFARTTDILHRLLDDPGTPLARADLIVEWDVAVKRALPWPSSVNGVIWGAAYEFAAERRIPSISFEPRPAADAGLLVIRRRRRELVPRGRHSAYRQFVATGFRHGVRSVATARALRTVASETAFARDLDAHEWAALFAASSRAARAEGRS
jgi:23S rRNA (adenine-N6)-dimethyltransferase